VKSQQVLVKTLHVVMQKQKFFYCFRQQPRSLLFKDVAILLILFIVVYCRPSEGEFGHHNMRIIGKPRLCENCIWCLDPGVWIRIRYGSGSSRIWKLWIRCTPNLHPKLHHQPTNSIVCDEARIATYRECWHPFVTSSVRSGHKFPSYKAVYILNRNIPQVLEQA